MHSPLPGNKLALGGNLIHDVAGPTKQNSAFIDVAYRIQTGTNTRLAFGLSGGVNLFQADIASLSTVEVDPHNANIKGKALPNFGFGLYWHAPRYYVGLSAPKLLENLIGEDDLATNQGVQALLSDGGLCDGHLARPQVQAVHTICVPWKGRHSPWIEREFPAA